MPTATRGVLVHPTRAVMPRNRWLEVLADYVVQDYELHERIIDVDDDIAAVVQRATMHATVLGEDRYAKAVDEPQHLAHARSSKEPVSVAYGKWRSHRATAREARTARTSNAA